MFEDLAKSAIGNRLQSYIERIIRQVESVRTKTDLSVEARVEVGNLLEENFINRLKLSRGEIDAPSNTEYE